MGRVGKPLFRGANLSGRARPDQNVNTLLDDARGNQGIQRRRSGHDDLICRAEGGTRYGRTVASRALPYTEPVLIESQADARGRRTALDGGRR